VGAFISSFRNEQYLMEKLKKCRAKMKMYAENSPRVGGHDIKRFKAAEKEMLKTAKLIDGLTESNLRKQGLKILMDDKDKADVNAAALELANLELGHGGGGAKKLDDGSEKARQPVVTDIYSNIDANAVVAFVTFEYNESFARCVSDYRKYAKFPYSLFEPPELQFHGCTIHVEPAPEPDQILWENIVRN
jgi:hypothetical protein